MRRRRYDLAHALYCKACILQEERRIGAGWGHTPGSDARYSGGGRCDAHAGSYEADKRCFTGNTLPHGVLV